ncbi:sensor histidine kinase [Sunxiuqinia dokdonensis]|uniref:histidine kinase n=1 Tax=Sunxiuqinia dokdonensis TaxID=1409788 RepID=A0A0L8V8G3_9BACT|nr:PAS domain-containing sensor histidine kinase [Sunxiuqinia dokdonensis]KOH44770.1 histidine kinase [Sunxiuqinia dokdonensis]
MLKAIYHFITKPYLLESGEDKRKITGLHVILILGLLYAFIELMLSFSGYRLNECIPGDVTLMTISLIGLYCLRSGRPNCAVLTIFVLPLAIYFFFISDQYAILPVTNSIPYSMWSMVPGFLFLLLFSKKSEKHLLIYLTISLLTVAFHVQQAGRMNDALMLFWPTPELILNPFATISLVFTATFLVAVNFELNLKELRTRVLETDQQINKTVRSFQQGVLLVEVEQDEMNNPTGLKVLKTNPAFQKMFRVNQRETHQADGDVIFPKVFRNSFDWNNYYLHSKNRQRTEVYVEHLEKWFEVFSLQPAPNQIASIFYDITKQRQIIDSLQESRKRYKVLLEAIPDIFFIIDKDGVYMDFVIKESELIQINADDIVGNSIFEVGFSEKMSRKIFQCIQDAINRDTIETIEYALEVEKGTAMFEMRIARLDDHSVISIARDITKRKIAEIRLEEAKLKAEEADQLKSAFLANISHEIRTPMNAIIGFSKMVGSPDFDVEEKNRFIDIIISNGKLLMEMINDMISLSKIESNQVKAKESFCKVNDLMVELYRQYSFDLTSKPIRLKLNNQNANPKFGVTTDKYLLEEILKKLLDNAVKFTNQGEIEFGYRMKGNDRLLFFVKDTGIGIDIEQIKRIFERFHQIDNKTTRKYEGTGLGLAIAQHYSMLLGGKIEVNSAIDQGSEFYFSIPFKNGDGTLQVVR